ncbi:uncharacterized protein LOC100568548 [Acyrthosiphon pisum]|uniref:Uncharacterized protein n=1 Tax=Acyrthosiphon pisum TaxID=7029 RepID=A0A8R1W3W7_ACYPI|nr:uncharacterized protein LOC100568548 [Acyrthosiphon pisum]|eukprot:XP_003240893.1 PREDICTED: uncharacterized protein LOC100568548 [Acyrthosiphon pisum]
MTSPVVVILSIFAILIISSEAATIRDYDEFPGSNIIKGTCPAIGLTAAEYRVTVITETRSESMDIGGCASIDLQSPDVTKNSFNMWIGSLKNGMQRCREDDMEQFNFTCVSLPQSEDFMKGIMFAQILGRVNTKGSKQRCAIHDMVKGNATMFRIAVSGNDSCHGLADLLQSNLQTTIPDGATVLQLNRIRLVSNQLRSEDSAPNGYGHSNVINHFSGSWVNKL